MLKRLSVASLLVTSLRNNRSSLNVFSSWSSIRCFSASDSSRAGDGSARGRTSIARRAREKNKKSDNRSINNRVPYDYAHPNFITYLMSHQHNHQKTLGPTAPHFLKPIIAIPPILLQINFFWVQKHCHILTTPAVSYSRLLKRKSVIRKQNTEITLLLALLLI